MVGGWGTWGRLLYSAPRLCRLLPCALLPNRPQRKRTPPTLPTPRRTRVPLAPTAAAAAAPAGPRPDDAPSLSERMGRLLGAVHAAFGGRAAVHFLYAVRQAMPAQADGQADFGDRLWLEAVRAAEEQWAGWGELAEVEEGPVATAAEVRGGGRQGPARLLAAWPAALPRRGSDL